MKIASLIIYNIFIISALLALVNAKSSLKDPNLHPNVGDIYGEYKKMVRPYYSKEFFPQEVDSILEKVKPAYDFQNAEIVGKQDKKGGLDEKPTMYSTVIVRHPTSISHPVPKVGNIVSQSAGALLTNDPVNDYPVRKISPGQYSIPVKLETKSNVIQDAVTSATSGYESPEFKGQSSEIQNLGDTFSHNQIFMTQVREDVNKITSRLKNVKNNKKKIKILNNGKKTLEKEAKSLTNDIQKIVARLINAKEIGLKMNNILTKYELKLKKSQMSKLKLADVITMKKNN